MRVAPILNVAAKVLLVVLLLYAVANPEMPRFAGKAMGIRAVLYPLATLLILLVWLLKGRPHPYPHAADTLLAGPFIVDVGGNVANLYDTVVWFDDAAHAVTWMLLVLAIGALLLRLRLAPWITAALCIGFGSVTHVLWEILEYLIMISGRTGLHLTYGDTVGDLAASLSGSVLAGLVTGWIAARSTSGQAIIRTDGRGRRW
jgi:hypothetical protein